MEQTDSGALTTDNRDPQAKSLEELAQEVFASKAERRRWLAALPVEEKYRRFLQLQRMASAIRRAAGKPSPAPWPE